MPSLQKFTSGGRVYWRIVESRRVNGKPRPIPIYYIGSTQRLIDLIMSAASERPYRVRSRQHGAVAALKAAADLLGVVELIDSHLPRRSRGLSVGTTLLLAAMNRVCAPTSKGGVADWAETTSLETLLPGLRLRKLSSEYSWEQMDGVDTDSLEAIEEELTRRVVDRLDIGLDALFYDTTNFFTYIAAASDGNTLAERGHSKQERFDLRQVGLALLVSRDGQIPLVSRVHEGNLSDSSPSPESLSRIRERLARMSVEMGSITVVYDRSNLSRPNLALVDASEFGYVASLTPSDHPEPMGVPTSEFDEPGPGVPSGVSRVWRDRREIWGTDRTVVMFISEELREGQTRSLMQDLDKALAALREWKRKLAAPGSGPRTVELAQRRIDAILSKQYLKRVVSVHYDPGRSGSDRLDFWVDTDELSHLAAEVLGRRILVTDRHDWQTGEIIAAYHGRRRVEAVLRPFGDNPHVVIGPQEDWTDHRIRIHAFVCWLGLLLARVVEHRARQAGWQGSLDSLLDELSRIRLAILLRKPDEKGGRPKATPQLEDAPPELLKLFTKLVPNEPPFVHTSP